MSRQLRKSLMAALGAAVLAGVSTQASAISVNDMGTLGASPLVRSNITGALYGWDGNNNANMGWTHSTQWTKFTLSAPASIEVKLAPKQPTATQKNVFLPAFTLWATTAAGFVGGNHNPNYSYDANNPYGTPTHPYNQVRGVPANLDGQLTPVSPGHGPDCPAGGCNSNNWLVPGGGGFATADGITALVGYANAGPVGWTNGNGDVVGAGVIGSDNNGPLEGVVDVKGPDWSAAAGGPTNTVQYASLQLYNLSAGTYFLAPGGSCFDVVSCGNSVGFSSITAYSITVSPIAGPVPIPAAVWLFASGLAGLGVFGRRRVDRLA